MTTIRDIEQASQPPAANGPPAPDESSAEQPTAKRRRKQTNASKRRREEATSEQRPHSGTMHANMAGTNRRRWDELRRRFGRDRIQMNASSDAPPLELHAQAQAAARLCDLDTHVATATRQDHTVPQWNENTTWDPGD